MSLSENRSPSVLRRVARSFSIVSRRHRAAPPFRGMDAHFLRDIGLAERGSATDERHLFWCKHPFLDRIGA